MIRGTDDNVNGIDSNVMQYKLGNHIIGQVVSDIANHPWTTRPIFDAIVCDPPYGVRAGSKKISSEPLYFKSAYFVLIPATVN
jgi:tRNA (guanine10-N2)-methyltransferase